MPELPSPAQRPLPPKGFANQARWIGWNGIKLVFYVTPRKDYPQVHGTYATELGAVAAAVAAWKVKAMQLWTPRIGRRASGGVAACVTRGRRESPKGAKKRTCAQMHHVPALAMKARKAQPVRLVSRRPGRGKRAMARALAKSAKALLLPTSGRQLSLPAARLFSVVRTKPRAKHNATDQARAKLKTTVKAKVKAKPKAKANPKAKARHKAKCQQITQEANGSRPKRAILSREYIEELMARRDDTGSLIGPLSMRSDISALRTARVLMREAGYSDAQQVFSIGFLQLLCPHPIFKNTHPVIITSTTTDQYVRR